MSHFDVVVIGAGAAGIAAARRLQGTGLSTVVLEARLRLGGRAWTRTVDGLPLDMGCGWLHSAGENEWAEIARMRGFTIDRRNAPWRRSSLSINFPIPDQEDFARARDAFDARVDRVPEDRDCAASELLEPGNRWNALLNAVSTFANGVELDRISAHDFRRYRDSGINWRVAEGYGALVCAHATGLDVRLGCAATLIDHSGTRLRIETSRGDLEAEAAVVTVPTSVIGSESLRFRPALPDKLAAADALPLGLADKLFLHVAMPDDLPAETRVMGAIDRLATASYHLRPFGLPVIEAYFGGAHARALEGAGEKGFAQFAIDELAGVFGNAMRKRLRFAAVSAWDRDEFARGSYSYGRVGCGDARARLAAAVEDRLFFAGEACSAHDFSTAHGAYRTGVAAAEAVLARRLSDN
ncbi:MAG TPA: NAD(P)/FAD-dependent oxidoreductase [Xanthobacteraceae bacterium]|nr:NAD(P)/FAD-dependent oxidoreductase [Xanthobacteraceae bacterium]